MFCRSSLARVNFPALLIAMSLCAGTAKAGPLTPPVGAVGSTMKTLAEVEPRIAINLTNTPGDSNSLFRITQPGSYYLTGNVNGVAGKAGIEIAASHVTVDLNGFALTGVAGSFAGVVDSHSVTGIVVSNGLVRGWGASGVLFNSPESLDITIRDVRSSANSSCGFLITNGARVENCSASSNAFAGFTLGHESVAIGCDARGNSTAGFEIGNGSVMENCRSSRSGTVGIQTGVGVTVANCAAIDNTGVGIAVGTASVARNCTATYNNSVGITGATGSRIESCVARSNDLDGIRVSSQSSVMGNTSSGNGVTVTTGAGIRATGGDNRIESNNCTGQDTGFDIDVAGNLLLRNTASGNTDNWALVPGNVALIVLSPTNATPILGNAGGAGYGTTDPNANLSY